MAAALNALAIGLVAQPAADALARGDTKSLGLAAALIACNLLAAGCSFFGGRS